MLREWMNQQNIRDGKAGLSNLWPTVSTWPSAALHVAQHEFVNVLKTLQNLSTHLCLAHQLSVVNFTCDPRRFFFFRCGPEEPKCWGPVQAFKHLFKIYNYSVR